MRQLQQRLEETESQMTRILQAMQSVQQHVSGVVDRASANSNIHESAQTSNDKTKENPNVHEEKCPEISENENKHCEKCENVCYYLYFLTLLSNILFLFYYIFAIFFFLIKYLC